MRAQLGFDVRPMRTIWNGSLNFGLVNIPIGLAVAQQRKDTAFRTLHRECGTPIKQKRYCPFHERDVEADELVKGWEFAKNQFVMVEESDLEAVALQRSQSIDIVRFVPIEQVDPIYFDRTYYLAPSGADAQRRPYVLLLRAMQEAGMAAVGKFVLWGKENLCLIRPLGDSLALETLYFAEDIRPRAEIDEAVEETDVNDPELTMARQLVESLVGDFDPEDYENEYRNELRAMLEAKLAGQEVARPEPTPVAPVVDLMEALKQSVAQAQKGKEKPAAAKPKAAGGRKRAAAKR
jgi:DNA end-binding protein Ku